MTIVPTIRKDQSRILKSDSRSNIPTWYSWRLLSHVEGTEWFIRSHFLASEREGIISMLLLVSASLICGRLLVCRSALITSGHQDGRRPLYYSLPDTTGRLYLVSAVKIFIPSSSYRTSIRDCIVFAYERTERRRGRNAACDFFLSFLTYLLLCSRSLDPVNR